MGVKILRFLDGDAERSPDAPESFPAGLEARWVAALDRSPEPAPGRPVRVALAVPLDLSEVGPPPFAAIDILWFDGLAEAQVSEAWLAAADPELALGSPSLGTRSCQVMAEEVVLRGPDYLQSRWDQGGERLKMTSFGKRNPELSLAEFSARWQSQAGRLGDEEIPADLRGLAYVQNHPLPLEAHEWPFDAINEVYFEQLDHLQRRRAYFAARQHTAARSTSESFISPTERWSMLVREWPLGPGPPSHPPVTSGRLQEETG
jgi:hypothetical protein